MHEPKPSPELSTGQSTTAIVGGGIAGLTCASLLQQHGQRVTVFDKGRGPGGRLSTRRYDAPNRTHRFDHGAQYFTARDSRFVAEVEAWTKAGVVCRWNARLGHWRSGELTPEIEEKDRFVGVPSMSRVLRHLVGLAGLDVRFGHRVIAIERLAESGRGSWRLEMEGADLGSAHMTCDRLILAVPAPQAAELLEGLHTFTTLLDRIETAPCHALMIATPFPIETDYGGLFVAGHPVVSWLARDSSKPGRTSRGNDETWVLQTTSEWSRSHLEEDPADLEDPLVSAFRDCLGFPGDIVHHRVHRWRHARTTEPLGQPFLWDETSSLGLCGDWCLGARVEAAFNSGLALAETLLDPENLQ